VLAVVVATIVLLAALNALVYSLYRSEQRTVATELSERLSALGGTAARWLAETDPRGASPTLAVLVDENHLDDAYVVDTGLHVIAGVRTPAGSPLNLLRVDQERLAAALAGTGSVGPGYSIANVDAAYFPIGATGRVLAIEAGEEFHAPVLRGRTTYLVAVVLSLLVAIVFALAMGFSLRSLERARIAHGRTERLAAVGQMAAMVAHEVRNPLGILRGQVELARERLSPDAPPRERERFGEMVAEIDRLNRLTEEFLGLARDLPLERAAVDVRALAVAVVDAARVSHAGSSIAVTGGPEEITLDVDADRLRQAMLNLVLNALQVGGDGVAVTIDVSRRGDATRISVADDGPGIPPDIAADLFEPFVTSRSGGTGLGLAVARRIAEAHGGALVLESPPGERGAVFSIYLPEGRS
jgi:signal transduction histidine kinase